MSRARKLLLAALAAFLLPLGAASALTIRAEDFVLRSNAGFSPKRLPYSENAPIVVSTSFGLSLASGGTPPIVNTITYLFDRHGRVDVSGLPRCSQKELAGTNVRAARRVCSDAIVGRGTATATIELPEQEPFSASSPITLFNGPEIHGQPSVLAHAYASLPVPTTFIVPVVIERVRKGIFGYRVAAEIPPIANGYGHLVSLSYEVGRSWMLHHRLHSYINARCETGRLAAQAQFVFADARELAGSISKPCITRHR